MRGKEKILYIVLACISILIISFLVVGICEKNQDLTKAKDTISQNETDIKEKKDKIASLEKELENSKAENEKIKSQLNSANAEKDKLQKENGNLKKEIENLRLKKKQSALAAVKKPAVQTPKPATQTAPPSTATKSPAPSSANKVCYLTFDDGPSPRTLEILKILKKYNVKATFFVINTANFDYVKQIHSEGHAIGIHAFQHDYSKIYKNKTEYFKDFEAISNKIYSVTGVKTNIMRFPGGSSNVISKRYCKGIMSVLTKEVGIKGYSYFDWNVDSDDAGKSHSSYTKIINNVLNNSKNKNSICVLMHDARSKTSTVQALPKIIEGLIDRGYRFDVLTNKVSGFHHSVNN